MRLKEAREEERRKEGRCQSIINSLVLTPTSKLSLFIPDKSAISFLLEVSNEFVWKRGNSRKVHIYYIGSNRECMLHITIQQGMPLTG